MTNYYLFVYGTLLEGESNHAVLGHSCCVHKDCWVYGKLYNTGLGYPVIELDRSETHRVYGELYEITSHQLIEVDKLEGYQQPGQPNLYDRVQEKVYVQGQTAVFQEALLYCNVSFPISEETWIPAGDWRAFRQGTRHFSLVFQETWERAISQQDRRLFANVNAQNEPVTGNVRFVPVRTGFNHEGKCFATVLIQNGTNELLNFSEQELRYKLKDEVIFTQMFQIPELQVQAQTSTPWTFLFKDETGIREQVEKGFIELLQWGVSMSSK